MPISDEYAEGHAAGYATGYDDGYRDAMRAHVLEDWHGLAKGSM
jgi:flagellar biosynthesis/type III secretory pathway protein FliH